MPESDEQRQCSFELDPEAWSERTGRTCWLGDVQVEEGNWTCPHEPVEGRERCPFHLDIDERPASISARERLLEVVNDGTSADGKRGKQFIGATFETLELPNALFAAPDQYPIDLRYCHIEGDVDWTQARFEQPVRLDASRCQGDVSLTGATFEHGLSVPQFVCEGELTCKRTRFRGRISGTELEVHGETNGFRATVAAGCEFHGATFHGDAKFQRATFREKASFTRATFNGTAKFSYGAFDGEAAFANAEIADANFLMATFEEGFSLTGATVADTLTMSGGRTADTGALERISAGNLEITGREFEDGLLVDGCQVNGESAFDRSTFHGRVTMTDAEFEAVSFDSCTVAGELVFEPETCAPVVPFTDSDIADATIAQPTEGETLFNVSDATLGEVTFVADDATSSPLSNVAFRHTAFDGFDFPRYRSALSAVDDRLHEFTVPSGGSVPDHVADPDPGDVEATYLKAKNGADDVGDASAAATFFIRELHYRRATHWEVLTDASQPLKTRLRRGANWVQNLFFDATCGYGERPGRTVAFSAAIIGLFAVLYHAAGVNLGGAGSVTATARFSLQSFVALIVGGLPSAQPTAVELLAALEAFLGAFFIALFVFALTRSVHR
jgi:hypothetical protein